MKNKKLRRKAWFRFLKCIMRLFIGKTKFTYLGEEIKENGIILSNHEGTKAPLAMELYSDLPLRFWGAYEMNSGLVKLYKYQTRIYYHEKKHWNLHLARLFCLIASPLTNIFYKGLNLISTYRDTRFRKTLKESLDSLEKGYNVVIFPEVSDKGYLKELEGFHNGFILLLEQCQKKNINVPIYVTYFKKDIKEYVIDKPIYLNELIQLNLSRDELAKKLCDRCNELGRM